MPKPAEFDLSAPLQHPYLPPGMPRRASPPTPPSPPPQERQKQRRAATGLAKAAIFVTAGMVMIFLFAFAVFVIDKAPVAAEAIARIEQGDTSSISPPVTTPNDVPTAVRRAGGRWAAYAAAIYAGVFTGIVGAVSLTRSKGKSR